MNKAKKLVLDVPDFPKKGIIFKDITPLLASPKVLRELIEKWVKQNRKKGITKVGGDEFSDPELLKEVLDNRVGPQDELTQQSALVPAGLGDHPCGVLARPRVRSVFL